jgi:hypothetical protein
VHTAAAVATAAAELLHSAMLLQVEAPAFFPPSFLYTQSWEDPRADEPHLQVSDSDVCLTLTSGGCNSLQLCINGARKVGLGRGGWQLHTLRVCL